MKLLLHGQEIESVFDLLGYNENGLTYALGWILSNNDELLKIIVNEISGKSYECKDCEVRLQEFWEKDQGFTDVELLVDNDLFLIIEAKIGWKLPGQKQLSRYSARFKEYRAYKKRFVIISECTKEYAIEELKNLKSKIPIEYLSWHEIHSLVHKVRRKSSNQQKRICDDFEKYFRKVINTQNKNSNKVFCVVLNRKNFDVVMKNRRYRYPLGKNWPHDPPNYIAFRYEGRLHSIHHVDDYEMEKSPQGPMVILILGKPFKPAKEVKNGKIYPSQHLWFDLDTVFVCRTIKEARDITQKREEKI